MNSSHDAFSLGCPRCGQTNDSDARFCKHCAFSFETPTAYDEGFETQVNTSTATGPTTSPSRAGTGLIVVLVVVVLILFAAVAALLIRSRDTASAQPNAEAQSTTPQLGSRAQSIEEKILRGETLSTADIEGISTAELRILRNVHFARHGRKYDRPGLGDYFFSRSWYKPSETYTDNQLTATDKANVNLILTLEKPETVAQSTPAPTPTATPFSSNGALTQESAQDTIDRFVTANGSGQIRIRGGVRELPAENAATAELDLIGFVDSKGRSLSGKPTTAVWSKYTDGRWALTKVHVRLPESYGYVTYSPTIYVR